MRLDPATVRAIVLADVLALLSITAIAWFLGFELIPAVIAGLIAGTLSALVVWAAATRARSLGTDQPTPPAPRFPGEPEHEDDDLTDGDETRG